MMKTKNLPNVADALYQKMQADGYSNSVIGTARWVIGHFYNYCLSHDISVITVPTAVTFVGECFGFDYYNTTLPMQTVMRRPILILFEFEESGNYCKTHQRGSNTDIPLIYKHLFLEYREVVNATSLCRNSKERKLWIFVKYFEYLEQNGIFRVADIQFQTAHEYINSLASFAPATIRCIKTSLREIYDWLYSRKYIPFSGRQMFPVIRKDPRNKLLSYYSKEEIGQMLSCIDTETPSGKCAYSIICMLAYLGMRAGDVIRLKFSDIDWHTGTIHYIQQKTGNPLSLPLTDEVKYPLLDYIKNGRHESADPEYIFVTMYAPYTRFKCTSSLFRIVDKCMKTAGIDYEGRHHGPHALRHSMATNMMSENVPVSTIANILGHSSTKTTEIYLAVDETHLKNSHWRCPMSEQMKKANDLPQFTGPFGGLIPEYISYKRAQGYKFGDPIVYRLREMDLFFKEMGIEDIRITREMYEAWTSHRPPEKEQNIQKRQSAIRGFAKYLILRGYPGIYTGQDDTRIFKREFIPYIFPEQEISRMFRILYERCQESPGYENDTFRMAMLLYYCCGFRKTEVQNLRIEDIDFSTGKISILHGKNDVSRVVVASDTLLLELRHYRDKYLLQASPGDHFLHGPKSSRYCETALYGRFHQLLTDAGIMPRKDGGRQRLHDIRHTFCVRALSQMQEKGFDLYTSLPLLSRYLGHKHITETEYYLRLLEEHFDGILDLSASCHPGIFPKHEGGDGIE